MTHKQFAFVRLRTDRYRDRGVEAGALGVIVDVYDEDAYEVDFVRPDGTSIAWFAVTSEEIEPVDDLVGAAAAASRNRQD